MENYPKEKKNKLVRSPARGQYSHVAVHEILDSHYLCHVAYVYEGTPICIPTAYGRKGETIYLHGARSNRMLNGLLTAEMASMTVTHLDGIVMARSVFHHSFNYRSAVVFGKIREVADLEEVNEALEIITEQILPGRWDEARVPTENELKSTLVIALEITTASAKIRSGDPKDEAADYKLPIWAGVLPLEVHKGVPVPDLLLSSAIAIPPSIAIK